MAAADLLSRRAWTRSDLDARLRRRGAPADVAAAVVDDLTSRGYLNDDAFARQWVEARSARGYGRARLRAELRMRGVAASIIDSALRVLATDDELDRARGLARRRFPALTRAGGARAPARLRDYLLRRGFSAAVVARVVRETSGAAVDSPVDE